jgi:hypothetical protein
MMRRHYVVADLPKQPSLYERLEQALLVLDKQYGMLFVYQETEEMGPAQVHSYVEIRKQQTTIQLVEDAAIPATYLIVEAGTPAQVSQIAAEVRKRLPFVSVSELQQQARKHMAEDPQALMRLAIGAGEEQDTQTLGVVVSGLQHPDAQVRDAAAMAAGTLRWPGFVPVLRQLVEADPRPSVRSIAQQALEACGG